MQEMENLEQEVVKHLDQRCHLLKNGKVFQRKEKLIHEKLHFERWKSDLYEDQVLYILYNLEDNHLFLSFSKVDVKQRQPKTLR